MDRQTCLFVFCAFLLLGTDLPAHHSDVTPLNGSEWWTQHALSAGRSSTARPGARGRNAVQPETDTPTPSPLTIHNPLIKPTDREAPRREEKAHRSWGGSSSPLSSPTASPERPLQLSEPVPARSSSYPQPVLLPPVNAPQANRPQPLGAAGPVVTFVTPPAQAVDPYQAGPQGGLMPNDVAVRPIIRSQTAPPWEIAPDASDIDDEDTGWFFSSNNPGEPEDQPLAESPRDAPSEVAGPSRPLRSNLAIPGNDSVLTRNLNSAAPDQPHHENQDRSLKQKADGHAAPVTDVTRSPASHATRAQIAEAMALNRRGISLATRGAYYSARDHFIEAIHTVASSIDESDGGNGHSLALVAGLRALKEANELVAKRRDSELELAEIVSVHTTPALHDEDLTQMTSRAAVNRYMVYAQERLADACGNSPVASESLTLLGKLTLRMADEVPAKRRLSQPTARACFQAALLSDDDNHIAANELGVLLARNGELAEARNKFQQSVQIRSEPVAWRNLADAHQRLGESDLAQRDQEAFQLAVDNQQRDFATEGKLPASVPFELVGPEEFRQSDPEELLTVKPTPGSTSSNQPAHRTALWKCPLRWKDRLNN